MKDFIKIAGAVTTGVLTAKVVTAATELVAGKIALWRIKKQIASAVEENEKEDE